MSYRSTYDQDKHATGRNDLTAEQGLSFARHIWAPAYFRPMMPEVYRETLERARRLKTLYGVEP
jgi:hypothetical protein